MVGSDGSDLHVLGLSRLLQEEVESGLGRLQRIATCIPTVTLGGGGGGGV